MRIWVIQKRNKSIIHVSIAATIILIGVIALLQILTPSLSVEDAEKRVRLLLQRELSQKHMSILKKIGQKIPDHNMAIQWEKEIRRIYKCFHAYCGPRVGHAR